jgi:F-box and WD-40 domain protein 1/11
LRFKWLLTIQLDPVSALPPELVTIIFANLDDASLKTACLVSSKWREHANSSAVWRQFFLSTFTPSKIGRSSYLQIGGMGLGKKERVGQEWKKMSLARIELEKRWANANPVAIYFCGTYLTELIVCHPSQSLSENVVEA